jgi:hypothetical protein
MSESRSPVTATDLIVRTRNPELLDRTVQQLGPAVVVEGSYDGETCRVRVFGSTGYIKFALANQGYGELVGEEVVT